MWLGRLLAGVQCSQLNARIEHYAQLKQHQLLVTIQPATPAQTRSTAPFHHSHVTRFSSITDYFNISVACVESSPGLLHRKSHRWGAKWTWASVCDCGRPAVAGTMLRNMKTIINLCMSPAAAEAGPQVNVWPPWTLILMNHWGRFLSLSAVSRARRGGGEKFGKFIDFEIIIINNIFFYVLGKFVEIHLQNCWKSIKTVGVNPMSEWGEVKLKWVSFWECSGLQQEFNKIW